MDDPKTLQTLQVHAKCDCAWPLLSRPFDRCIANAEGAVDREKHGTRVARHDHFVCVPLRDNRERLAWFIGEGERREHDDNCRLKSDSQGRMFQGWFLLFGYNVSLAGCVSSERKRLSASRNDDRKSP